MNVTLNAKDQSILGITQPCGLLRDGVQHRLNVHRRGGDKTQNLAGGDLLTIARLKLLGEALYFFFELAQFGGARTLFLL